ncbi:MAG: chromate transporter [Lachnospiraceae bacterium]|nr:chromate transporter [Lachnospiraceae bacterium]
MSTLLLFLRMFFEFFKTGLFAIGGGLATVPFLSSMGTSTGWFSSKELADMIAVSESTPGPIGVNMATYVGYVIGHGQGASGGPAAATFLGILGAIIATIGLITPSVIIILIVAHFLEKFRENEYVAAALYGLRAASVGLITSAAFSVILIAIFGIDNIAMWRSAVFDVKSVILAVVIFVMSRYIPKVKDWHPIFFILIGAACGIIFHMSGS